MDKDVDDAGTVAVCDLCRFFSAFWFFLALSRVDGA